MSDSAQIPEASAAAVSSGPGQVVMRTLPACATALVMVPLLAWLVPRDSGHDWWGVGILMLVLVTATLTGRMTRGWLGRPKVRAETSSWQDALATARTHGSLPTDPELRLSTAVEAGDRIMMALVFTAVLLAAGLGALARPDLHWTPPLGCLLVFTVLGWFRFPAAWTYLRLHAAGTGTAPRS